jgi:hypothetical protein
VYGLILYDDNCNIFLYRYGIYLKKLVTLCKRIIGWEKISLTGGNTITIRIAGWRIRSCMII